MNNNYWQQYWTNAKNSFISVSLCWKG